LFILSHCFPEPCPGALAQFAACLVFHGQESAPVSLLRASSFGSPAGLLIFTASSCCLALAYGSAPPLAPLRCFGSFPAVLTKFDFGIDLALIVCELLQGEAGDILELSDQKAQSFLV
jgi:hypothetical protein